MALKNSEYNAILRQYDQRQFQNLRSQEKCRQKVYEKVPGIRALDEQIAHTAAEYARKSILQKSPQILGRFKADMKLLEEEKSRLLIAHGFPKDYLQLHYHCADCKDTGFIGNEKCHCFKQAIADLIYEQSNIREKIKHENFASFNMDYYPDRPDPQLGISPREHIGGRAKSFILRADRRGENLSVQLHSQGNTCKKLYGHLLNSLWACRCV